MRITQDLANEICLDSSRKEMEDQINQMNLEIKNYELVHHKKSIEELYKILNNNYKKERKKFSFFYIKNFKKFYLNENLGYYKFFWILIIVLSVIYLRQKKFIISQNYILTEKLETINKN